MHRPLLLGKLSELAALSWGEHGVTILRQPVNLLSHGLQLFQRFSCLLLEACVRLLQLFDAALHPGELPLGGLELLQCLWHITAVEVLSQGLQMFRQLLLDLLKCRIEIGLLSSV